MSSKFFGNKTKDKLQQKNNPKQKFNKNVIVKSNSVRKTGRGK